MECTDLRIPIRLKMSRIRNTGYYRTNILHKKAFVQFRKNFLKGAKKIVKFY
jgi:hypothetical protein